MKHLSHITYITRMMTMTGSVCFITFCQKKMFVKVFRFFL